MAKKHQNARMVELESGGTITVSFDFSVFDLSGRDREFVNYLVDMMRDYEKAKTEQTRAKRSGQQPTSAQAKS